MPGVREGRIVLLYILTDTQFPTLQQESSSTILPPMPYQGQPMLDYTDEYEEIFNRLAAMQSHVSE